MLILERVQATEERDRLIFGTKVLDVVQAPANIRLHTFE